MTREQLSRQQLSGNGTAAAGSLGVIANQAPRADLFVSNHVPCAAR
jgi:hypothetical protein